MKRLLKNGTVVNVFTGELIKTNVLFENGIILGVDDYGDDEADEVIDAAGKAPTGGEFSLPALSAPKSRLGQVWVRRKSHRILHRKKF